MLYSSVATWVTSSRKNVAACFVFQISLYNFVAHILFQFYLLAYPSAWHILTSKHFSEHGDLQ